MYLVMEYVRGEDLGNVLRRDGPMDVFRAGDVVIQVCNALSEAHERGVIHRDVKPENILLTRTKGGRDFVKIVDFGLARIREEGEPAITAQGSVIGTPYYMSPEQARGDVPDGRTDIYSLGGVFYRSLTGEVPYPAPSPMVVLTKCLTEDLKPPRERRPDLNIPVQAEEIIMRAMAKNPDDRYQTASEMAEAVQRCLDSLSRPDLVPSLGSLSVSLEDDGRRASDNPETWSTSLRLNRSDFDTFERALRRRRRLQKLMIPLVVLILAGVSTYFFWPAGRAQPGPAEVEQEPNNTMEEANPIANGRPIKGIIGRRLSETESDIDVFRFELPEGAWIVKGELWPQRHMDLVLRVYGEDGPASPPVVVAHHSGESGAEAFTSRVLTGGVYYAVVSESVGPKGPQEGVSDYYKLKVSWEPLTDTHEQEPNDSVETAQRVSSKGYMIGAVNDPDDVDYYVYFTQAADEKPALGIRIEEPDGSDDVFIDCISRERGVEGGDEDLIRSVYGMQVEASMVKECCINVKDDIDRVLVKVSYKPGGVRETRTASEPGELYSSYRLDFEPKTKCRRP